MKLNTKYDGKDITITLTKEQIAEISKQTNNQISVEDIDYKSACKLLKEEELDEDQFIDEEEYNYHILKTIIKAVNYIDNGNKIWKADWKNQDETKYIPLFERSSGGWFLDYVHVRFYYSSEPGCFYYKSRESANLITNKYITLYSKILG